MTNFGITPQGFVKKTFVDILTEKITKAKLYFGENIDLRPTSSLYKFLQLQAMEAANLWDMTEHFWYNMWISTAEGVPLEMLGEFMALDKHDPTKAVGMVTFTGTNYTLVPLNTIVSTYELSQGIIRFKTTQAKYVGELDDEIITFAEQGAGPTYEFAYTPVSPILKAEWFDASANDGAGAYFELTEVTESPAEKEYTVNYVDGEITVNLDGIGGGMATGDNLRIDYVVSGVTSQDIAIECTEFGAKGIVPEGSIQNLDTQVAGVTSVANTYATTDGANQEIDNLFRKRMQEYPRTVWSPDRIKAEVLNVDGVKNASVIEGVARQQFVGQATPASTATLSRLPQDPIRQIIWYDYSGNAWYYLTESTAPLGSYEFECDYETGVITLGSELESGDLLNVLYVDADIGTGVFLVVVDPIVTPLSAIVEQAIAAVLEDARPPGIGYSIQEIDKIGMKVAVSVTIEAGYVLETVTDEIDDFLRYYIDGPASEEEAEETEYTGVGVGGLIVRNEIIMIIMSRDGVSELANLVLHIEDEPIEVDAVSGNDLQVATQDDIYPYGENGKIYAGKGKTGDEYVEGTDWTISDQHITWLNPPSGTVYINYKSVTGNAQIGITQSPDWRGATVT